MLMVLSGLKVSSKVSAINYPINVHLKKYPNPKNQPYLKMTYYPKIHFFLSLKIKTKNKLKC